MAECTDRPHDAADVVMYLLQVRSYCRLQKWGLLNVFVDRSTELTFQVAILLPMRSVSSFKAGRIPNVPRVWLIELSLRRCGLMRFSSHLEFEKNRANRDFC